MNPLSGVAFRPILFYADRAAGRALLRVDQATFTHQAFYWHVREHRQYSNMDRDVGLRAGGYRQKEPPLSYRTLYSNTQLQILSAAVFEKMPWQQVHTANAHASN